MIHIQFVVNFQLLDDVALLYFSGRFCWRCERQTLASMSNTLFKRRLAINWFVETEMCASEVYLRLSQILYICLSVVSVSFCHRVLIAIISWIRVHTEARVRLLCGSVVALVFPTHLAWREFCSMSHVARVAARIHEMTHTPMQWLPCIVLLCLPWLVHLKPQWNEARIFSFSVLCGDDKIYLLIVFIHSSMRLYSVHAKHIPNVLIWSRRGMWDCGRSWTRERERKENTIKNKKYDDIILCMHRSFALRQYFSPFLLLLHSNFSFRLCIRSCGVGTHSFNGFSAFSTHLQGIFIVSPRIQCARCASADKTQNKNINFCILAICVRRRSEVFAQRTW